MLICGCVKVASTFRQSNCHRAQWKNTCDVPTILNAFALNSMPACSQYHSWQHLRPCHIKDEIPVLSLWLYLNFPFLSLKLLLSLFLHFFFPFTFPLSLKKLENNKSWALWWYSCRRGCQLKGPVLFPRIQKLPALLSEVSCCCNNNRQGVDMGGEGRYNC